MHVFEVTLRKDRSNPKQTPITWPEWWGDVYTRVDTLTYQDEGRTEEGALCVCDDETWERIAAHNDPAIQELDEDTANAKGRAWRPQVEKIDNQEAALCVLAKAVRGEELTDDDRAVIDPDNDRPGVRKSPLFDVRRIAQQRGEKLKGRKRDT